MVNRIVFMGSPNFAVPSLVKLVEAGYQIEAVLTQPDRPAGRGRRPHELAVKRMATQLALRVLQPERLREEAVAGELRAIDPDLIVVAAFGQILPRSILSIPRHGCLNVHASLLPKYRGAAPINAAIASGEAETGVTVMLMEPGLDTGPVLAQRQERILAEDTTESLSERLAVAGAELLVETIPLWVAGQLQAKQQDEREASYAPVLRKEDGHVDWGKSARDIERRCRAYHPWPGCFAYWRGKRLKLHAVRVIEREGGSVEPGTVLEGVGSEALVVATGEAALAIDKLQPEGGKPMAAREFVLGHSGIIGTRLD